MLLWTAVLCCYRLKKQKGCDVVDETNDVIRYALMASGRVLIVCDHHFCIGPGSARHNVAKGKLVVELLLIRFQFDCSSDCGGGGHCDGGCDTYICDLFLSDHKEGAPVSTY